MIQNLVEKEAVIGCKVGVVIHHPFCLETFPDERGFEVKVIDQECRDLPGVAPEILILAPDLFPEGEDRFESREKGLPVAVRIGQGNGFGPFARIFEEGGLRRNCPHALREGIPVIPGQEENGMRSEKNPEDSPPNPPESR